MATKASYVILVTGASSGIGQATVQQLATSGHYVYATARRFNRLEPMRSERITPLSLDVTQENSISSALTVIQKQHGRLDVLVNAAGYGLYGTMEGVTPEQARHEFDVNVFGLARITQLVLPLMRQHHFGRIINLSSVAGKVSTPLAGWYSASKHAVEAFSDALRLEVAQLGIRVVLIEPGAIKTEFDTIAFEQLEKAGDIEAYHGLAKSFSRLLRASYQHAPGPQVVARTIVHAIHVPHPHARYALPNDSRLFIVLKRFLNDNGFDRLLLSQIRG